MSYKKIKTFDSKILYHGEFFKYKKIIKVTNILVKESYSLGKCFVPIQKYPQFQHL